MSKRVLLLRKQLKNLKKQYGAEYQDFTITLDFSRSREDIERLTGYNVFLTAIHEIAPDTKDWEWTKEQIQRACDKSGMCSKSITGSQETHENITIQIQQRR